ncbi:MAG: PQQ-binding-like beta-propeller repeat protein, partial [Candidatus Bathyarchaeia archaeon]
MNKSKASIAVSLSFIFAIAVSLVALPAVNAQVYNDATAAAKAAGMYWDIPYNASATRLLMWNRYKDRVPTWVYGVLSPNPVGVGQRVDIIMFNPQVPYASSATNDITWQYQVTIKKPDGTEETFPSTGTIKGDSTGSAYISYTPDKVGNYTVTVKFVEMRYLWNATATMRDYYGVLFLGSSKTYTLVVQEEPVIPKGWTPVPLPTEYWTRPIEGQNTEWWRVASNWYSNERDQDYGGSQNRFQRDGTAPNTGHILWTKPTEDGGVIGGDLFSVPGEVFNAGHQYQTRFTDQIIMHGRLYYQPPRYWSGGGGQFICVDLRTGEKIWEVNTTGIGVPTFGYYYDWDDMNQHGIVNPGWLFTANFARAYHPLYGEVATLNITDVPSGFEVVGPKGEVLRYVLTNIGTSTNPNWRLLQWNSSRVFTSQSSGTINASLPTRYDWNVSVPVNFATSPTIRAVQQGDVLLGSNGSHPVGSGSITYHYPENVTFWALSLKPGEEGRLLWMKTITTHFMPENKVLQFQRAAEGVFTMCLMPEQRWRGYSMYTGELLWEATEAEADFNPFGYYSYPSLIYVEGHSIAYGKLFTAGYKGAVWCYDLYNGTILWKYEAPTNMEKFQYYPLFLCAICDGKIFVGTHEHSADTPLFKGNKIRALDVNTGKEVWAMYGWAHPQTVAIADGILIYWNNYDHQIYAVGKGPSATSVSIQNDVVTHGSKVLVKGSVIDISAGTRQHEQAARFPNGVPAVADESMSAWMEYVYMQKPRPADVKGVEVVVSVLDP